MRKKILLAAVGVVVIAVVVLVGYMSIDTTAPTVSSTIPANAATAVAISGKIAATFSEAMDPLTITLATFTVTGPGGTPVAGTMIYTNVTAVFAPASSLVPNTEYTCTVTTGVKDLAGNALARDYVWSFTTGSAPDTTAPTVSSTIPAAGTAIAIDVKISAIFSEAMDPSTITTATFTVTGPGGTPVTGTVTYDAANTIATFDPTKDLAPKTKYTATITTGAKDQAGNALASDYVWTFRTA